MKVLVLSLMVAAILVKDGSGLDLFGGLTNTLSNTAQKFFQGDAPNRQPDVCNQDVYKRFQLALHEFYTKLNLLISENNSHYVFSPLSVWLSIMTLAEGCDPVYQKELFAVLNLPEQKCLREQYYNFGLKQLPKTGDDVEIVSKNLFVLDEYTKVEPNWAKFADGSFLELAFSPIKSDPNFAAENLRQLLKFHSTPILNGNSALFNSIDFQFLWRYTFAESEIQSNAPFYNDAGKEIGRVDLMRMKRRVRLAHLPHLNAKVLELPVGHNGRYKMIIVMNDDLGLFRSFIGRLLTKYLYEILESLKESIVPLEVAIPRFDINFEFDARIALENMGIKELWSNPSVTSYISQPPALPGSYHQRVLLKVGNQGLEDSVDRTPNTIIGGMINVVSNVGTGAASVIGREFIANKPFGFMLLDGESSSCIFAGAYTGPTVV